MKLLWVGAIFDEAHLSSTIQIVFLIPLPIKWSSLGLFKATLLSLSVLRFILCIFVCLWKQEENIVIHVQNRGLNWDMWIVKQQMSCLYLWIHVLYLICGGNLSSWFESMIIKWYECIPYKRRQSPWLADSNFLFHWLFYVKTCFEFFVKHNLTEIVIVDLFSPLGNLIEQRRSDFLLSLVGKTNLIN